METDFVDAFGDGGFVAGFLFLLHKIYDKWTLIRWNMSLGVRQGSTVGQIYFACCIAMLLLFIWLLTDIIRMRRRDGNAFESKSENIVRNIVIETNQLISMVTMLLAIICDVSDT